MLRNNQTIHTASFPKSVSAPFTLLKCAATELGTQAGKGRGKTQKERARGEEREAGSMELWIAAYGSRKRVTVAKTVLVSPWLVLEVGHHCCTGEACLDWRLEQPARWSVT